MSGRTVAARRLALAAVAASVGPMLLAGGTASAATGRITQQVLCGDQALTIAVAPGNNGNNWGAGQFDGGHLVQATLEYAVYDDTAAITLDVEILAHGRAHAQQETVTCDVAGQQATLADVAPADFHYPPGTAPTDLVTSSLRATVVPRP